MRCTRCTWSEAKRAPKDPNWRGEFDKMVAFAQSKGWVEADVILAELAMAATQRLPESQGPAPSNALRLHSFCAKMCEFFALVT